MRIQLAPVERAALVYLIQNSNSLSLTNIHLLVMTIIALWSYGLGLNQLLVIVFFRAVELLFEPL